MNYFSREPVRETFRPLPIADFGLTPAELESMHPLIRAAFAAAARDKHPARRLSALLNAALPLIKLQEAAAARRAYDLDGTVEPQAAAVNPLRCPSR
jgi:hypothetical protein